MPKFEIDFYRTELCTIVIEAADEDEAVDALYLGDVDRDSVQVSPVAYEIKIWSVEETE